MRTLRIDHRPVIRYRPPDPFLKADLRHKPCVLCDVINAHTGAERLVRQRRNISNPERQPRIDDIPDLHDIVLERFEHPAADAIGLVRYPFFSDQPECTHNFFHMQKIPHLQQIAIAWFLSAQ